MTASTVAPGELGELRFDPDPERPRNHSPIRRPPAVTAASTRSPPSNARDAVAAEQLDAVLAVDRGERRCDLLAEHALERQLPWQHRGDVHTELRQRSGDLAADEPHPHDHRVPACHGLALDRVALGDRAQLVDALELGAGDLERGGCARRSRSAASGRRAPRRSRARRCARWRRSRRRRIRERRSTSCSSYQAAGLTYQPSRSSSERMYVFDSGGRPKGIPGSRPMITTSPSKPCLAQRHRRVSAREPAADDHDRPAGVSRRQAQLGSPRLGPGNS